MMSLSLKILLRLTFNFFIKFNYSYLFEKAVMDTNDVTPVKNNRFIVNVEKLNLDPKFIHSISPLKKRQKSYFFGLFKKYEWDDVVLTFRDLKEDSNLFNKLMELQTTKSEFNFYYKDLSPQHKNVNKWYVRTGSIKSVELNSRNYKNSDINKISVVLPVKECRDVMPVD